ncbi:MAG: HlyD family efflux transporter periplasmic adaptor subunit [Phycisphaeraceae bacterium]|nr:HlyD family efflux transporter periplasmic adaptor subunit [Phycisphaeraceae bacterium]
MGRGTTRAGQREGQPVIDLSNLKAPGWGKVVADLSAAAHDDKSYMDRLMGILAQVSAARQAVLWIPDRREEGGEVEPRAASIWPPVQAQPGAGPMDGPTPEQIEQLADAKSAARGGMTTAHARAYGLDAQNTPYYDAAPTQGYVLAIPLPGGGLGAGQTAVVTLLIESRSKDALRSTLAMAEVLAGYVHGHSTRQALKRTQHASLALDLATKLIASVNTAPNFKGAAMTLCNDLAKQFSVDRVALGWVRGSGTDGDSIRVESISDTEHFDRRMAMVEKLKLAMEECFDQSQPVMYPPPPSEGSGGDVLLSQAIVHAHRELVAADAGLKVCSLPLRIDERVVGVVTLESKGQGQIDLASIELVQAALDLVAPVLRVRRSDDRNLALRAKDSMVKAAAWAVGPKHTVWKAIGVTVAAALLFVTFFTMTYRVGCDAVFEPRIRRVVSAPMEGVLLELGKDREGHYIEPGRLVKKGDLLVQMDDKPWRLSAAEARAKMHQAELLASAARKEDDRGKVEQADAQYLQAKAELDVYEYKISQSRITSPIDGVILAGRLEDRIGSSVKLGDALIEVSPMDDMLVVAKVDERDIALVTRAMEGGKGKGVLASKARPNESFDFTVERIVPLAEAKEGKNTFAVYAKLDGRPAAWMRPGMEARTRFDTEKRSLLWIGTRRIIETVQLWFW